MRASGAPASDVRRRIATELADDVPWNRVLNSICTEPHPLGVEMASAAAHTNLGDVRIFRGTKRIERRVVRLLLDLMGNPGGSGSLVSGGTEANLIALLVARESARARGRLTDRPEVVVSSTVHFSFTKIFGLLGLTPVVVPVDDSLRLPAGEVARRIGEHTVAVVATAGSSEFGVVDAVDEIGPVVAGRDVHLHVDAATGGFIIPFARELGHDLPQFDFSVDGVDSITIDPHKYGLANVPAGAILFRGAQDAGRFAVDSFFIDTPVHNTLLGTRPGAAAVSTYAVLEHLGRDGFRDLTRTNFEVTQYLVDGLRAAGHELFAEPQLNIVVVRMPHAVRISQLLESKGWIVSTSKRFGETLRLVVTRHVTPAMVDEFLPVLERACKEVAAEAAPR
ncbi:tyrosine decarboxylase MfnA [Streptomyces collinus]|uniref:Tyrosine decarboxylase MfnA n=1 Tax=Streptomyces violaceochromogenes TaxID=67377 RepID=A0ABU6LPY6_9ACTN|nr:tyrosine decarboxylase MfnA [Streptomyces violaceochromogenes]MEC7051572.1 tyrosine decarboxylase MfnA [Streptomyces violaceochromogenes]GHC90092.1 tyrosine decarboxylase MfnA [Streptomyces violaceochromogenes]